MIKLADETLFPHITDDCEIVRLNGIGKQPVFGRLIKNVSITIGKCNISCDVCVIKMEDKLILGLDFLDACKAVVNLAQGYITILDQNTTHLYW